MRRHRVERVDGDDAVPGGALVGAEGEALANGAGEEIGAAGDVGGGAGEAGEAAGVGVPGRGKGAAAVGWVVDEFLEGDGVGEV